MADLNFPTSPTLDDTYSLNGKTWTWNGEVWESTNPTEFKKDGTVAMTGDINLDGNNIDNGGVLFLKEQVAADVDVTDQGQIWVKTATPNELWFTDDAGTDVQLGVGVADAVVDGDFATDGIMVRSGGVGSYSTITDNSTNWDSAFTHVSNNGSDHSFIDQSVTVTSSPEFANLTITTAGSIRTETSATNTLVLQAYDTDLVGYVTFATLTANASPSFIISDNSTWNGNVIAEAYLQNQSGTNTGDQTITLTGDVTGTGTGSFATTISADSVTLDMMVDIATASFLGRDTATTGTVEVLSKTTVLSILNVEDGADVTDATNVDAAGAVMNSDTSIAAMSFYIDDDTMATASATTFATSESIKAYADMLIVSSVVHKGGYDAATDTPSLDDGTPIAGILQGWMYTVTVAGDFFSASDPLEVGDVIIADQDSPTLVTHWTIVNKNLDAASTTTVGVSRFATIAETNTGTDATIGVTPDGLDGWTGSAQVTTVGVLDSGSVSSGFGNIDIGTSTLTCGVLNVDNSAAASNNAIVNVISGADGNANLWLGDTAGVGYSSGTSGEVLWLWTDNTSIGIHGALSTTPNDIQVTSIGGTKLLYDYSASEWNFQDNDIRISRLTTGAVLYINADDNEWANLAFGDETADYRGGLSYANGTQGEYFDLYTATNGLRLHSNDSATPKDIEFLVNHGAGTVTELLYDQSLTEWNFQANTIKGDLGTLTAQKSALDLAATWNNVAVDFTAITLDVTDTLSTNDSRLIDFKKDGASKFIVWKDGSARLIDGPTAAVGTNLNIVGGDNRWAAVEFGDAATNYFAGIGYGNGGAGERLELWTDSTRIDLHSSLSPTPNDIDFVVTSVTELLYDDSLSEWNFQGNDLITTGNLTSASIFMDEKVAADADVAGRGQIWVKTATPNELWFTDDAGTDVQLGGGVTITDDTTTNSDWYPTFVSAISGTMSTAYVSSTQLTYNPSTGEMTSIDFISTSDERLKENIKPLDNGLSLVSQLDSKTFNWKHTNETSYGFIAQEVEQVIPELVKENGEGVKSVRYLGIISMLVNAVQELETRVKELEAR